MYAHAKGVVIVGEVTGSSQYGAPVVTSTLRVCYQFMVRSCSSSSNSSSNSRTNVH